LSATLEHTQTVDLISCIRTTLIFKTLNIIEGDIPITGVTLHIS